MIVGIFVCMDGEVFYLAEMLESQGIELNICGNFAVFSTLREFIPSKLLMVLVINNLLPILIFHNILQNGHRIHK